MSWFGAAEDAFNTVVETTEDVVETVAGAGEDVADTAQNTASGAASAAGSAADTLVAAIVTVADHVSPGVNTQLAKMHQAISSPVAAAIGGGAAAIGAIQAGGAAGIGAIQAGVSGGVALGQALAALATGALGVAVGVGAATAASSLRTGAELARVAVTIATYAALKEAGDAANQLDQLRGELAKMETAIKRLIDQDEKLRALENRIGEKAATNQQVINKLARAAALLRETVTGIGSNSSSNGNSSAPTEKEYDSAAALSRRLQAAMDKMSLATRRRRVVNPRFAIAQNALQRFSTSLGSSNTILIQVKSAAVVAQLKATSVSSQFPKPVILR